MPVEDKMLAMQARHAVAKSSLDISELSISCCRGVIELNGKIKRPRNFVGEIDMTQEFRALLNHVRATHGVKDVVAERVLILD